VCVVHTLKTQKVEESSLEMEPKLCGHRARRYILRAAERREEVVQGIVVRNVDGCALQTPLVTIPLE